MKVSDIMLDLETGDASVHDAYIQEAMGQVNVSAAIYDAAKNIASLDPSEMTEVIQEAATNAGLPTDREKAIELMYEAAERELIGTCRHLYQEASLFVESATSATSPTAVLDMLAKKCGAKTTLNPSKQYAKEFAQSVLKCKELDVKKATFIKGSSAQKVSAAVIKAFVHLAQAAGISIPESITNNDSVKAVVPALPTSKCDGECSVSYIVGNVQNAADALSSAFTTDKGEKLSAPDIQKTDKPTRDDIATVMCCWFAVVAVANAIKGEMKSAGSKVEKKISAANAKQNKKKASGDIEKCNASAPKVNADLKKACSSLNSAFKDAFYSIISTKGAEV